MKEIDIYQLLEIKRSILSFSQKEKDLFIQKIKEEFKEKAIYIIKIFELA